MSTAPAYARVLDRLGDRTAAAMLTTWDQLDLADPDAALIFHGLARPTVEAAAQAAVDVTAGYFDALSVTPAPVSDLVVADAAARCFDPFDRLARNLANGLGWEDSTAGARAAAGALGDDAVFRTARAATGQMGIDLRDWQRRLSPNCCQWCMKLSSVVFSFAHEATFGHNHCRCVPVPVDEVDGHNQRVRNDEGFDPDAERRFDNRRMIASVRKQSRTAQRRFDEVTAELRTERDPKRRDRLEIRQQEWETRREAAEERLRMLRTGTHLLP